MKNRDYQIIELLKALTTEQDRASLSSPRECQILADIYIDYRQYGINYALINYRTIFNALQGEHDKGEHNHEN